jgi:hypothetical protein
MKYCWSCKETKDVSLFGLNKSKPDGLATECKECKRSKDRKYVAANREILKQKASEWYYNNKEYANKRNREYSKNWRKLNKDKNCSKSNKYRASKLNATPIWVCEEHKWLIDEVYHLAKIRSMSTGISWHVDHILPLKGKEVCGLHVIENLQVIPASINISKGNRLVCSQS